MSGFGMIAELFTVRLQRAEYLVSRATSKAWGDLNLRKGSIGVLSLIASKPGISQNEIARLISFDKSAVTAILNNFERLGWAERRASGGDRRRHALHVTDEGRARLQEIFSRVKAIETHMLAQVPAGILQQLADLLDLVHASCLMADPATVAELQQENR